MASMDKSREKERREAQKAEAQKARMSLQLASSASSVPSLSSRVDGALFPSPIKLYPPLSFDGSPAALPEADPTTERICHYFGPFPRSSLDQPLFALESAYDSLEDFDVRAAKEKYGSHNRNSTAVMHGGGSRDRQRPQQQPSASGGMSSQSQPPPSKSQSVPLSNGPSGSTIPSSTMMNGHSGGKEMREKNLVTNYSNGYKESSSKPGSHNHVRPEAPLRDPRGQRSNDSSKDVPVRPSHTTSDFVDEHEIMSIIREMKTVGAASVISPVNTPPYSQVTVARFPTPTPTPPQAQPTPVTPVNNANPLQPEAITALLLLKDLEVSDSDSSSSSDSGSSDSDSDSESEKPPSPKPAGEIPAAPVAPPVSNSPLSRKNNDTTDALARDDSMVPTKTPKSDPIALPPSGNSVPQISVSNGNRSPVESEDDNDHSWNLSTFLPISDGLPQAAKPPTIARVPPEEPVVEAVIFTPAPVKDVKAAETKKVKTKVAPVEDLPLPVLLPPVEPILTTPVPKVSTPPPPKVSSPPKLPTPPPPKAASPQQRLVRFKPRIKKDQPNARSQFTVQFALNLLNPVPKSPVRLPRRVETLLMMTKGIPKERFVSDAGNSMKPRSADTIKQKQNGVKPVIKSKPQATITKIAPVSLESSAAALRVEKKPPAPKQPAEIPPPPPSAPKVVPTLPSPPAQPSTTSNAATPPGKPLLKIKLTIPRKLPVISEEPLEQLATGPAKASDSREVDEVPVPSTPPESKEPEKSAEVESEAQKNRLSVSKRHFPDPARTLKNDKPPMKQPEKSTSKVADQGRNTAPSETRGDSGAVDLRISDKRLKSTDLNDVSAENLSTRDTDKRKEATGPEDLSAKSTKPPQKEKAEKRLPEEKRKKPPTHEDSPPRNAKKARLDPVVEEFKTDGSSRRSSKDGRKEDPVSTGRMPPPPSSRTSVVAPVVEKKNSEKEKPNISTSTKGKSDPKLHKNENKSGLSTGAVNDPKPVNGKSEVKKEKETGRKRPHDTSPVEPDVTLPIKRSGTTGQLDRILSEKAITGSTVSSSRGSSQKEKAPEQTKTTVSTPTPTPVAAVTVPVAVPPPKPEDLWNRAYDTLPPLDMKLQFEHQRNLAKGYKGEADQLRQVDKSSGKGSAIYLQSIVHFALMCRSIDRNPGPRATETYSNTIDMLAHASRDFPPITQPSSLLVKVARYLHLRAHAILCTKQYSLTEEKALKHSKTCKDYRKTLQTAMPNSNPPKLLNGNNGKSPSPGTSASPYSVGSSGSHSSAEKPSQSASNPGGGGDKSDKVPGSDGIVVPGQVHAALTEFEQLSFPLINAFYYWNRSKGALASEQDPLVGKFDTWLQSKAALALDGSIEQLAHHLYVALWVLRAIPEFCS